MDMSQFLKRKSDEKEEGKPIDTFLISKKSRTDGPEGMAVGTFGPAAKSLNRKDAFVLRIKPLHLEMPTAHFDHNELNHRLDNYSSKQEPSLDDSGTRHPFFLSNLSADDDNEPRKFFTLYDIKNDETTKSALEAKRKLRFTNVHHLICPQEKMFLTTACDYFQADYDELIDYIVAIGELRNKQIIVEHCYYKLFMHTLKMFYYTDKGWRFNLEFEEFFSGYLRKYREPIVSQMTTNFNNAKKAAAARRAAVAAEMARRNEEAEATTSQEV